MPPLSDDKKKELLERLKAGKAKRAAARAEAKEKGLPDPHPRKKRAPKKGDAGTDGAVADPLAHKSANDTIPGIDSATKPNVVADAPVKATPEATKPIDVPNLPPGKEDLVVKQELRKKAPKAPKPAVAPAGVPKAIQEGDVLKNSETGNQVIPAQYAGQLESIKKVVKKNKTLDPVEPKPVADPPAKTVKKVKSHIPDVQAVEGRAPFSFSAVKKLLYQ